MAIIKTSDGDVKLFTAADAYRYDIDNRPLRELIQNDINVNNELAATTAEVVTARTDNSTGSPVVYSTLDARLEAMGISSLGNSSVSYSIFQSNAEKTRALYPSGWLQQPSTQNFSSFGAGFSGDDWSGLLETAWSANFGNLPNHMFINNEYSGLYNPVHLFVNGWHIKVLNMNANGASPYGSHTTIKLPTAPSGGGRQDFVFLEVWLKEISDSNRRFWLYGSPQYNIGTLGVTEGTFVLDTNGSNGNYVADPLDQRVVHSLSRLSNGNWLQVQHRIRVFSGVNPTTNADGFTGTTGTTPLGNAEQVFAQGSQNAPVTSKPYSSMNSAFADAGLFRAGLGAADTSALGTYDGYSYAIPIAMVHRRNTDFFSMTNQNGCKKTGDGTSGSITSTVKSGRPDLKTYDGINRDDYLDMRNWIEPSGFEYERLMQRAFDEVLTGSSRSQWEQADYSGVLSPIYGNRLLTNDTIFSSGTYGANPDYAVTVTNAVKDNSKSSSPQSTPDGVRQNFASSVTPQRFEFWVDPWASTTSHAFIGFETPGANKKKIRLNLDTISGGGGAGGTYLRTLNADGSAYLPQWRWQTDNSEITLTRTNTVTQPDFEWDVTGRSGADGRVYGHVDIIFPTKSGTTRLPNDVIRQDFFDGATTFSSFASTKYDRINTPYAIAKDTANRIWVSNHALGNIQPWEEAADGSLRPVPNVSPLQALYVSGGFPDSTTGLFSAPTGIAVWGNPLLGAGSGAIYLCDYYNRTVKKYTYNTGTGSWIAAAWIRDCGFGANSFGSANNPYGPWDCAVTSDGATLYVSDIYRHVVFKIVTSTITGNGVTSSPATVIVGVIDVPGETTSAGSIKLNNPRRVTLESDGIWIADTSNHRVIKTDLNTPANILVNFKPTSNNLPSNQINAAWSIPLGPDSSAPTGYLVMSGDQGKVRIFRLDSQYNIVAISNTPYANTNSYSGAPPSGAEAGAWNLCRTFTVDDVSAPTRVYVGKDGYQRNNANEVGVEILNATTLATISRSTDSLNFTLGGVFSVGFIDGNLWATCNNLGIPGTASSAATFTVQLSVTSDALAIVNNYTSTTNGDSYGYFSNMITFNFGGAIGSRKAFWQTILFGSGGTRAVRWSFNGSAWVRDTAVTLGTSFAIGAAQDSSARLYLGFVLDNYVKRYDFSAGTGTTYTLAATFGTGPGTPGGTKAQVTRPTSIILAADGARIMVTCNKQHEFGTPDHARLVMLTTTAGQWTGGNTPYLSDTNNTTQLQVAGMEYPSFAYSTGNDVYIGSPTKHVIYRMTKTFGSDVKSFILTGVFGVENEAGTDHGHLNSPWAGVVTLGSYLVTADFGHRLLKFHSKMAGVSNASGNVNTMTALGATETLRIWHNTVAYQGVGKNLFAIEGLEYVFNNQVLASSDFLYSTSLGRSPIADPSYSSYKGVIDRIPHAGKLAGLDATSYSGTFTLSGSESYGSNSFFKLPITNYGQSFRPEYGTSSEDKFVAVISRVTGTLIWMNRGFMLFGTGYYKAQSLSSPGGNHIVMMPWLIKRSGRVYLLITTHLYQNSSENAMNAGAGGAITAADMFEVPGRLLAR